MLQGSVRHPHQWWSWEKIILFPNQVGRSLAPSTSATLGSRRANGAERESRQHDELGRFLLGLWTLAGTDAGRRDGASAGHNSSYKRDILLRYDSRLDDMMEAESVLHWDLRRDGYRLYLEPAAKTSHLNFTLLSSWVQALFQSGRKFAAFRATNEQWSRTRRLLFSAASPLIPLVRFRRIAAELQRPGRPAYLLLRVAPILLLV